MCSPVLLDRKIFFTFCFVPLRFWIPSWISFCFIKALSFCFLNQAFSLSWTAPRLASFSSSTLFCSFVNCHISTLFTTLVLYSTSQIVGLKKHRSPWGSCPLPDFAAISDAAVCFGFFLQGLTGGEFTVWLLYQCLGIGSGDWHNLLGCGGSDSSPKSKLSSESWAVGLRQCDDSDGDLGGLDEARVLGGLIGLAPGFSSMLSSFPNVNWNPLLVAPNIKLCKASATRNSYFDVHSLVPDACWLFVARASVSHHQQPLGSLMSTFLEGSRLPMHSMPIAHMSSHLVGMRLVSPSSWTCVLCDDVPTMLVLWLGFNWEVLWGSCCRG